jgi:hypothetical protein
MQLRTAPAEKECKEKMRARRNRLLYYDDIVSA